MPATKVFAPGINASQSSLNAPTLPPYSETPQDFELTSFGSSQSEASLESYHSGASPSTSSQQDVTFRPTTQLQIQTEGKSWLSFPVPTRPTPIYIFSLSPDGSNLHRPLYASIRPKRSSGSCFLVHADDEHQAEHLTRTTYRFGPGKPPVVSLAHHGAVAGDPEAQGEEEEEGDPSTETFEVASRSTFSRTQTVTTSLGTFEWRYASKRERAAAGEGGADNLLVFERVEQPPANTTGGKGGERRTQVAQLVRSERYRTPGTGRSTAGNGGRLMLDLRGLGEKREEAVRRLAVTTALVMLKKEVDRRRMHQMVAMGAAGSGGG
ncbi:uncharacterized protein JN550_009206 [Neoarthrinium moseri]|uniref:uncharacterized protein n=1 Tax=Neoarthrinium moseri TaxID=1658444 RepID=UPI001FDDE165|nr:uncharacterized protein JN550_009206 [Neoarthrinium moseri]KAI1863927.1 hypothetical protein JN550_009206 [Neoarthrinium moseri]